MASSGLTEVGFDAVLREKARSSSVIDPIRPVRAAMRAIVCLAARSSVRSM